MTSNKPIIAQWRQAAMALVAVTASVLAPVQDASAQVVLKGQAVPVGAPNMQPGNAQVSAPTFKVETTTAPLSLQQIQDLSGAPMQPGQQERLDKLPLGNSKIALLPSDGVTVARNFTGLIQAYVVRPSGNVEMYFGANLDDKSTNSVRNARLIGDNSFGGPRNNNFSIANDVIPRQTQYYTVGLAAADAQVLSQNQKLLSYIVENKLITPDGRIKVSEVNPEQQQEAAELQRFLAKKCLTLLPGKQQWLTITPQTTSTRPGLITAIPNGGSHVLYATTNLPANLNPDRSVGSLFKDGAAMGDPSTMNDAQKMLAAVNGTRIDARSQALPSPQQSASGIVDCKKIEADRREMAAQKHIPLNQFLWQYQVKNGYSPLAPCPVSESLILQPPPAGGANAPAASSNAPAAFTDGSTGTRALVVPNGNGPQVSPGTQTPPATAPKDSSAASGSAIDQARQRQEAQRRLKAIQDLRGVPH